MSNISNNNSDFSQAFRIIGSFTKETITQMKKGDRVMLSNILDKIPVPKKENSTFGSVFDDKELKYLQNLTTPNTNNTTSKIKRFTQKLREKLTPSKSKFSSSSLSQKIQNKKEALNPINSKEENKSMEKFLNELEPQTKHKNLHTDSSSSYGMVTMEFLNELDSPTQSNSPVTEPVVAKPALEETTAPEVEVVTQTEQVTPPTAAQKMRDTLNTMSKEWSETEKGVIKILTDILTDEKVSSWEPNGQIPDQFKIILNASMTGSLTLEKPVFGLKVCSGTTPKELEIKFSRDKGALLVSFPGKSKIEALSCKVAYIKVAGETVSGKVDSWLIPEGGTSLKIINKYLERITWS